MNEREEYEQLGRAFADGVKRGFARGNGLTNAVVAIKMHGLLYSLNMSEDCSTCPRYIDDERLTPSQRCRGHLTWVCHKIRNEIKQVEEHRDE